MTHSDICASVQKLKKKYCETDPVQLCRAMGILLLYEPMGTHDKAIKGFYMKHKRIRTISVNSDLPAVIQKVIIAHELGHAVLHECSEIYAFHEVSLFSQSSDMEQEANLFAAEFLLDDETVLAIIDRDTTFFNAASRLMVPPEMLVFKFRLMAAKGYKLTPPPIGAHNDFICQIEVPQDPDYCSELP